MTKWRYFAYLPDPFGVQDFEYVVLDHTGDVLQITVEELSRFEEPLITYEASTLVAELSRRGYPPPRNLIDAGDALRICTGLPRNEGGERKWDIWKALGRHFDEPKLIKTYRDLYKAKSTRPDRKTIQYLLLASASALLRLWTFLLNELKEKGEYERFFDLEVPVNQLFLSRQHLGIAIDGSILEGLLKEAERAKYTAYTEVAHVLNVSPSGMTYWNIKEHLGKTDASHLADFGDSGSLESYFKMAGASSKFAVQFYNFIRAGRNVSILTRLSGEEHRVFPTFKVGGTITGRILVSDPWLQQIRKAYRSIISADDGLELLYLDFAQFEPGILASFSNDAELISDYNSIDLYTSLSEKLFDSSENRNDAKQIFLAFSYGMRQSNIAKLLVGNNPNKKDLATAEEKVISFFSRYTRLAAYKKELEKSLIELGYASSARGNRRYRKGVGRITAKERRWAVNQVIQGTGSLIFKEALVGLQEQFGSKAILLPMHDAILMQFKPNKIEESREIATDIMVGAFRKYCKTVEPRVVAGGYAE